MFISEIEEGRKRGKEKNQSAASPKCSDQGSNPQCRYVPWPELEPETSLVFGTTLQSTELPGQGQPIIIYSAFKFTNASISMALSKNLNKESTDSMIIYLQDVT